MLSLDRKKDLVKLQAGEYVSLGKVEAELKTCSVVENICVYGDPSKQFTVALVVPNQKHLEEIALRQGVTGVEFEDLCTSPVVEKAVIRELAEHAKKCKFLLVEIVISILFVSFFFGRQTATIRGSCGGDAVQRGLVTGHGSGYGRLQAKAQRHSRSVPA